DQSGTWAVRIEPGGGFSEPVRVPLEAPLAVPFFTASPRAGCALTEAVDILSTGRRDGQPVALYTRLRFVPPTRRLP
ncbi:MAG: hypothetical protein GX595_10765, partial [Lentisphaerae bacterium]|nr:hypothetical protein [Lentisphaerota bacterium]